MAKILCVYYSRTGHTEKVVRSIARELDCEVVRLKDGVKRKGLSGWLVSGLHAVSRKIPPVNKPETKRKLKEYELVIIATPVWAGRCSAPVRSFLQQFGDELRQTAYVITRSCSLQYTEVYDQMDLYVPHTHTHAVSLQTDTIGADFWLKEFLEEIREAGKEQTDEPQTPPEAGKAPAKVKSRKKAKKKEETGNAQ